MSENKRFVVQQIIDTLSRFDDETNCGMRHEFVNRGIVCHSSITDRRLGCPHNSKVDVLHNALVRLYTLREISERTFRKFHEIFDRQHRELYNIDDEASGTAGPIDREGVIQDQAKIIRRRKKYRDAILRICERCLRAEQSTI